MFNLPTPSVVIDLARGFFNPTEVEGRSVPKAKPRTAEPEIDAYHQDRSQYARLLEKELDRQILTEVEREDTDRLNRVRSALYAE